MDKDSREYITSCSDENLDFFIRDKVPLNSNTWPFAVQEQRRRDMARSRKAKPIEKWILAFTIAAVVVGIVSLLVGMLKP